MARQNTTEFALLGILSQGPASGYDLSKFCESEIGHFWNETYSSIYPAVKRLYDKGWVAKAYVQQSDKPDKVVYEINDEGLRVFREWLDAEVIPVSSRNVLALKLYFGSQIKKKTLRRHIAQYRLNLLKSLAMLEPKIAGIRKDGGDSDETVFALLTVSQKIHATKAMLDWCRSADDVINGLEDEDE